MFWNYRNCFELTEKNMTIRNFDLPNFFGTETLVSIVAIFPHLPTAGYWGPRTVCVQIILLRTSLIVSKNSEYPAKAILLQIYVPNDFVYFALNFTKYLEHKICNYCFCWIFWFFFRHDQTCSQNHIIWRQFWL